MATSVIKQITGITAPLDGYWTVHVIATCNAQVTVGSDWGASAKGRVFIIQNSSQTNGNSASISTARAPYAFQGIFDLITGYTLTVGLESVLTGASAVSYYDITVRYVLVKR